VGPCLILAVGGPWIFKFVFGAQWVQSGVYVQVMAFVFLLKLTTDSVINFAIIERQDLSFSWALMRLVFVVLGIMTAVWCGLSGFWAVVFFAGAMIVSYLIKYGMWNYAITQLIAKKG
jgi:O-antigen/teichoic acid export membrane protein